MVLFQELKQMEGKQVVMLTKFGSVYSGKIENVRLPNEEEMKLYGNESSGYGKFDNVGFLNAAPEPIFLEDKNTNSDFPFKTSDIIIPLKELAGPFSKEENEQRENLQKARNLCKVIFGEAPSTNGIRRWLDIEAEE